MSSKRIYFYGVILAASLGGAVALRAHGNTPGVAMPQDPYSLGIPTLGGLARCAESISMQIHLMGKHFGQSEDSINVEVDGHPVAFLLINDAHIIIACPPEIQPSSMIGVEVGLVKAGAWPYSTLLEVPRLAALLSDGQGERDRQWNAMVREAFELPPDGPMLRMAPQPEVPMACQSLPPGPALSARTAGAPHSAAAASAGFNPDAGTPSHLSLQPNPGSAAVHLPQPMGEQAPRLRVALRLPGEHPSLIHLIGEGLGEAKENIVVLCNGSPIPFRQANALRLIAALPAEVGSMVELEVIVAGTAARWVAPPQWDSWLQAAFDFPAARAGLASAFAPERLSPAPARGNATEPRLGSVSVQGRAGDGMVPGDPTTHFSPEASDASADAEEEAALENPGFHGEDSGYQPAKRRRPTQPGPSRTRAGASAASPHTQTRPARPRNPESPLLHWALAHDHDPYPSPEEKQALGEEMNLTYEQVTSWFINYRLRTWKPAKAVAATALPQVAPEASAAEPEQKPRPAQKKRTR